MERNYTKPMSTRTVEHRAAGLGYFLDRHPTTREWHWQVIASDVNDWRGAGFITKAAACRAFAANATEAGALN